MDHKIKKKDSRLEKMSREDKKNFCNFVNIKQLTSHKLKYSLNNRLFDFRAFCRAEWLAFHGHQPTHELLNNLFFNKYIIYWILTYIVF